MSGALFPLQLAILIGASGLCVRGAKRDLGAPMMVSALVFGAFIAIGAIGQVFYAALAIIVLSLAFIIETDRRSHLIPDDFVLALLAIAMLAQLAEPLEALIGASLIGLCFLAVAQGLSFVRGHEVMGWGDVKLAVAIGALLGPLYGFYAVAIAGLATSAFLYVRIRAGALETGAPFGIGLGAATIIVALVKAFTP